MKRYFDTCFSMQIQKSMSVSNAAHPISSFTVGGMLMVEIFSIAKSFPLTKLFYLEEISIAESFLIMNLSAVEDKMT